MSVLICPFLNELSSFATKEDEVAPPIMKKPCKRLRPSRGYWQFFLVLQIQSFQMHSTFSGPRQVLQVSRLFKIRIPIPFCLEHLH